MTCGAAAGVAPFGGLVFDEHAADFAASRLEHAVTIDVHDVTGLAVPYAVDGVQGEPAEFDIHPYCGPTHFTVAPYSTVSVYLFEATAGVGGRPSGGCPGVVTAGVATAGTITAAFS